jgi:hypothetical protein
MTNEERAAIIAQTRANLEPSKLRAEREELARRTMELSMLQDPVAKWRNEADEFEARRAAHKRRAHAATDAERAAGWERWVRSQLQAERAFVLEVCGNALGELTGELRKEIISKIDELDRHFKAMKTLYDREISLAKSHIKLLQRQLDHLTAKCDGGDGLTSALGNSPQKYDA